MTEETTDVQVILGPYIGNRLTMSTADATSAINNHWATDPFAPLDADPHDPLTEQQRRMRMNGDDVGEGAMGCRRNRLRRKRMRR